MKKLLIKTLSAVFLAVIALGSAQSVGFAAEKDAVISNNEDFVPIYTTAPDSSLKVHEEITIGEPNLFYTQTTFLALVAGYLILFKAKGIDHSQKMHRRFIKHSEK
ncbi:MAG: hypothetical protein IIZ36_04735 [Ruminococcus sp.]|nr:hypothetical protein [Ruminococcus sp.]